VEAEGTIMRGEPGDDEKENNDQADEIALKDNM